MVHLARFTYALIGLLLIMAVPSLRAQNAIIYDGIDVSRYQADIDWEKVSSDKNIKFVYIKASEGELISPQHYHLNIVEIRKAGIPVGAYHFFRPMVPVDKQFANFTKSVKKEDQDLVPLIDVEDRKGVTSKALADSVAKFADMLEKHYQCRPMIYTGSSFYNMHLSGKFKTYPLFIARYSTAQPQLKDGAKWVLWQFTDRGRVDGIKGNVDMSRFNKGCGLADIMIPKAKSTRNKRSKKNAQAVPPPKGKPVGTQKPVAKRKAGDKQLTKEEEKRRKKCLEEERKEAERIAKQQEKLRKLKAKEEKEAAKQAQKRKEKEAKEAKKRAEQLEKEQKKAREDSLKKKEQERKQNRTKREAAAKAKQAAPSSSKAQASSSKASTKTDAAKAAPKKSVKPKRTNQSSVDND